MSFTSLLITTAIIKRPDYTQGASGAASATYGAINSAAKCRIWQASSSKQPVLGAMAELRTHRAIFAAGTDILTRDRVEVANSLPSGWDTYEVLGVNPVNAASSAHHVEVDLQMVKR